MQGTLSIEEMPSRNLCFYLRGENGKIEAQGPYVFNHQQVVDVVNHFMIYCNSTDAITDAEKKPMHKKRKKRGGCYACKSGDKQVILFLKFDEILYIELQ